MIVGSLLSPRRAESMITAPEAVAYSPHLLYSGAWQEELDS
jgi:hypothetical protein